MQGQTVAGTPGSTDAPGAIVDLSRSVTAIVSENLGQALEERAEGIAASLLGLFDARLCLVGRYEDGELICHGHAGEPTRISAGGPIPLRTAQARDGGMVELVGGAAAPEPLGGYLRLAGHRSAIVVMVGNETTARGAVVLAFSEALDGARKAEIAAAVQPLALLMRQQPLSAPETRDLQRQLEHAQKMEALGSMAGMIAHDFNNLLTTILGYTSILKNAGRLEREDQQSLDEIEEAAHRAATLTSRLLAFARGGLMRRGPIDLRAVLSDTLRLAEPALYNGVQVEVELPDEPVAVEGDEGQLQQAILNVVLNARDAMPKGGTIRIGVRREGELAVLSIQDNGAGMDATTRERIFDPFFTTKPMGSGTGLGMSITYGIVDGHGGTIEVESAKGTGTTFVFRLPALPAMPPVDPALAAASGDRDLVLVVDDDDMVRRTTMATLAHLGYNVVDAPSGRVAIELVRARPDRFAVVLLDLVMPDLTGGQTFKELRLIREDLPVIVCTGYALDAHLDEEGRAKMAGLIHKPFTADRLGEALSAAGVRRARE